MDNTPLDGVIPTETTAASTPKVPITGLWSDFLNKHLPEPVGEDVGTEDPILIANETAVPS